MVRNGNGTKWLWYEMAMVRNGYCTKGFSLWYEMAGTKWLWYEMTVIRKIKQYGIQFFSLFRFKLELTKSPLYDSN